MLKNKEIGIEKDPDILEKQANIHSVFLSLGSNLNSIHGDKIKNLELAQEHLFKEGITIKNKSSYYESLSFPNINDPKFINCVLHIFTNLKPFELMNLLLDIEKKLGRIRNKKNEPRICDIDIIDYDQKIINTSYNGSKLCIPHEKLRDRIFVLLPLSEIAPNWNDPISKLNIHSLIEALKKDKINSIKKI